MRKLRRRAQAAAAGVALVAVGALLAGAAGVAAGVLAAGPSVPALALVLAAPAAPMAKDATKYQHTGKIKVPTVMMIGQHDPVEPAGIVQRISDLYEADFAIAKAAAVKASQKGGTYKPAVRKLQVLWSVTPKSWSKFDAAGLPVGLTNTPGTGHTNFTMAQYKLVIDTALAAAENGDLAWNAALLLTSMPR